MNSRGDEWRQSQKIRKTNRHRVLAAARISIAAVPAAACLNPAILIALVSGCSKIYGEGRTSVRNLRVRVVEMRGDVLCARGNSRRGCQGLR